MLLLVPISLGAERGRGKLIAPEATGFVQMAASEKIRNVGPRSAAWLRQVGVRNIDDLREMGAIEVFARVVKAGFKPSLNLLYAMAGAEDDCHWTALSDERKAVLIQAAEDIQGVAKAKRKALAMGRDPRVVAEMEYNPEPSAESEAGGEEEG